MPQTGCMLTDPSHCRTPPAVSSRRGIDLAHEAIDCSEPLAVDHDRKRSRERRLIARMPSSIAAE